MLRVLFVLTLMAFASAGDDAKNSKRSLNSFGWNSLLGNSYYPWHTIPLAHGSLYSLSNKPHLGISAAHDIAAAIAAAKEATAAAALAHQRVQAAREQVLIQERVAAAKEAAAHAAIQRSEAAAQVAAAIQKTEALAAAAAAVHKSAAASAASAAAVGLPLSAGHWIHSKPGLTHWG